MKATNGWIRKLRLDEFRLLNAEWAGPVPSLTDAVIAFERDGLERLAPLSFDHWMDPAYYREVHPEYAQLSDPEVYRRWLFIDSQRDWPSSPEEHLRSFGLALSVFPEEFDWLAYARSRGIAENRWFALQHLVENGLEERDGPWLGSPGRFALAAALGRCRRGRDDASVLIALQTARALGDGTYATQHHLADAYFRRGEWREALGLFSIAAAHPEAGPWTFINGARAAIQLGAYRAATELLGAGRAAAGPEPAWRDAVHQLVEREFQRRIGLGRRLYATSRGRARGDRLVTQAAEKALARWETLDPLESPPSPGSDARVVILANFDIPACVEYRVRQKVEQLRRLGRSAVVYRLEDWRGFIAALPGAEAAIIFRLPAWPTVTRAILTAASLGVPTFYDIDDLVFDAEEFPDPIETYGGLIAREDYEALLLGAPLFRLAIGLCDFAIAPTSFLARRLEPLVREGRAFVVRNGVDARHETLALPQTRVEPRTGLTIFYASGTPAHTADFSELAGLALVELLQADPDARLVIVGHLALSEAFAPVRDQIISHPFTESVEALWGLLAEADINLAVLRASAATDAKSEIKWLEAAMVGVPSIVSATATYREVLDDGVDALIAAPPDDWRRALRTLAADPELRRAVARRAREKAALQYGPAATARSLASAIEAAAGFRREGGRRTQDAAPPAAQGSVEPGPGEESADLRRPAAAVARRGSSRVRLLYVQDAQAGQGRMQVEGALRGGGFQHLELTLLDPSRDAADGEQRVWGGSPVQVVGRTRPGGLAEIVDAGDVLLVPPADDASAELIQQAQRAGLWMVTGRENAGRDHHGDTAKALVVGDDPAELLRALRTIDNEPHRFVREPSANGPSAPQA